MKTLSDFKKRIQVGVKLHTLYYDFHKTEPTDMGVREVSIVQTNAFALKTAVKAVYADGTPAFKDSWCGYPKATLLQVVDQDTVTIFTEYANGTKRPVLTYKFITP